MRPKIEAAVTTDTGTHPHLPADNSIRGRCHGDLSCVEDFPCSKDVSVRVGIASGSSSASHRMLLAAAITATKVKPKDSAFFCHAARTKPPSIQSNHGW